MTRKISLLLLSIALLMTLSVFPTRNSLSEENSKAQQPKPIEEKVPVSPTKPPNKKFLSEFTIMGGDFLGDEWQNTWDVGGLYSLYFNKTFGVNAGYIFSPMNYDRSSTFGKTIRDKNVHIAHGAVIINNECSFKAGGSNIDCDLYLTLGGGQIRINKKWEPLIEIGGGMKIYTPMRWLAFRFDLYSFMHPTPNPTGNTFNSDMALNLGISFFIPSHKNDEAPK